MTMIVADPCPTNGSAVVTMEEVHRILHKIDKDLAEHRAECRLRDRQIQVTLQDHSVTLFGDGNSSPGLRMKTDRLEQRVNEHGKILSEQSESKKQHFWVVWTAAITAVIGAVFTWFHKP